MSLEGNLTLTGKKGSAYRASTGKRKRENHWENLNVNAMILKLVLE
jgi:hypothetical protein